jgi:[ribosomal protein S5]-alanine N-acetyltransferase
MMTIKTDRLVAAPIDENDFKDYCRMTRNPAVMATIGGVKSTAETKAALDELVGHWKRYKCGVFAFRDQTDNRFVGRAGFRRLEVAERREVEVSFALINGYWGKGFATEILLALVQVGTENFKLPTLVSFTTPEHTAARRVIEKAGFKFEKDFAYGNVPHVLYRIGERKDGPDQP